MTRFGWMIATCGALVLALASCLVHPRPRWLWNASASVPEGLYALHPATSLRVGDLVVAMPPEPLASFLAGRRYLPAGVPLVKRVTALPPQLICRSGDTILIDGQPVGRALAHDRRGRPLPAWTGRHRLARGEVFLMNPGVRDSLDGRYFGALPAASILGRAVPVWTGRGGGSGPQWSMPVPFEAFSNSQPEIHP